MNKEKAAQSARNESKQFIENKIEQFWNKLIDANAKLYPEIRQSVSCPKEWLDSYTAKSNSYDRGDPTGYKAIGYLHCYRDCILTSSDIDYSEFKIYYNTKRQQLLLTNKLHSGIWIINNDSADVILKNLCLKKCIAEGLTPYAFN